MIEFNHNFVSDKKSKSLSFFYNGKSNIIINGAIIEKIKKIGIHKKTNLRLNLHSDSNDEFHNMIIFHWKGTYTRPHKHLFKPETCHMIEGEQQIIILNDDGRNIDNCNLNTKNNIIYRINKDTFHTSYIISEYVIFHESKPGPYLGDNDSIYPVWSPFSNDPKVIEKFMQKILIYQK